MQKFFGIQDMEVLEGQIGEALQQVPNPWRGKILFRNGHVYEQLFAAGFKNSIL